MVIAAAGTAERAKVLQRALGAKFAAAAFGEIVNVLMRAPTYKHFALAELEWPVVPAVIANQFSLAGDPFNHLRVIAARFTKSTSTVHNFVDWLRHP